MFRSESYEHRVEKYKSLAQMSGLEYTDSDEFGEKALLQYFELFRRRNGKIRNLCLSRADMTEPRYNIFDYRYRVATNNTVRTYDQTVFFANSKQLGLPEFIMKPEHLGHRLSAFLGWEDIDFENYPIFSDKYHLSGEDPDFIRARFDDQVLRFFSKTSGWTVEAANYYLIFYSHDSLVPPNILMDFYRLGVGIVDLFKTK